MAGSINQLKKNNITTVLTTHSPAFLSYFIHQEEIVNLVIVQKEERGEKKGHLKNPLYLWSFLQDSKIEKEIKGGNSSEDKEYDLISQADEIIKTLQKDNHAKLNELKKIFTDFLKVEEK
ncbi:hypothetical protein C1645_744896 [Glomus cerebriforme]|uniref:Uncharacterized protein n=1 Tax=Glomus cerebriforme TaxID=658196 RepID=A0A397S9C8_9GLOM|nr:hypothetical protein C1645_744896 [Glomus cerebriforme]